MMQAQPHSRRTSITAPGRGPSVATSPRQTISSMRARPMSASTARNAISLAWMSEMSATRTIGSSGAARLERLGRGPVPDRRESAPEQRDDLVVAAHRSAGQAHEVLGELPVLAGEQQEPDADEVDALEDHRVLAPVSLAVLRELRRQFGVMRPLPDVMEDVIAGVEAPPVETRLDGVDAALVRVVWPVGIDERMLHPVAQHHHQRNEHERKDEHDERRLRVPEPGRRDCAAISEL